MALKNWAWFWEYSFLPKGTISPTISPTHSLRFEGDMKAVGPVVVVHPTSYDGAVELAAVQLGFGVSATSIVEMHQKFAQEIVKSHLLQVGF